jgi:hypothetical protein
VQFTQSADVSISHTHRQDTASETFGRLTAVLGGTVGVWSEEELLAVGLTDELLHLTDVIADRLERRLRAAGGRVPN